MKVPVSWLKEWVPVRASAKEIAKRLTFAGFEVEGIASVDGEPVLEVNVTPNRGDALSIRGIAREVAALYQLPLKFPVKKSPWKAPAKSAVAVSIVRPKSCPRYALAVIDNVKVGPSPDWLVRRLAQTGVRPVNNVVDVTNFVLMELGQPLHAFDRSKIRGGKILVRNAKPGETLKTLDGAERKLVADDLVIADVEGPLALAGVMGGVPSEVTSSTTSIALECAFFDPAVVRRASRRLGILSESSYRFERRVDPEAIPEALQRAVLLILETAGGQVSSIIDLYKERQKPAHVRFRPEETSAVLGGTWTEKEIRSVLQRLGFGITVSGKGEWLVTAPSYRGDVSRSVDLIEEVARLLGLDRVPENFPSLRTPARVGADFEPERRIKSLLSDLGLQETIHYGFVSPELAAALGEEGRFALANPLSREESVLRSSLLPSLLAAASHHARHKMGTFRAFELRIVFEPKPGARPSEKKKLAGLLMGTRLGAHWSGGVQGTDFYDLKGVVERILSSLGLDAKTSFLKGSVSYLHPGQQASLFIDERPVGVLGEVHPDVLGRFDLKKAAYVFELDWPSLVSASAPMRRFRDYPRLPVVERDLALVVDQGIEAGNLAAFIARQDPVIADAKVFDLYQGSQIADGKKSLAFSIRMSRADRTMTDEEVNEVFQRIIQGVKSEFRADVRH
jgi:phenylalanyl-tRNA synthetase beta chain